MLMLCARLQAFSHTEYETSNPYATRFDFGFTRVNGTNDQYRLE